MTYNDLHLRRGSTANAQDTVDIDPKRARRAVHVEAEEFPLLGRGGVFGGVTDFAYVPRDARAQIASGAGGRFALAGAKCERRLPARYGPAPEVPLEERGSGSCARQVRKFALAHAFDCDKLKIYGSNSFGHQRVSPSHEGVTDVLAKVRSGDAVLVPDGWHGPGGSASIRHT